MSLTQSEQQLLSAFAATFSESDNNKRETAIVYIKQFENLENFLPCLFELMVKYSHHNPKIEIIQAIINWIDKYIGKQYNPNYDSMKKISVIDLMEFTISGIDDLLKSKNIPHKTILLLSKPLSMMLNHKYNNTIKLQKIESFTQLSVQNPGLLFFELYSILNVKQSQTIVGRISPNLKNLIISLASADQTSIPFYLQVIYMLLKQMSINHLILKDIVNNKLFMDILLKIVQTETRQVSEYSILILTLLTQQKDILNLKATPLLNQINITLFPFIYQYLISSVNKIMQIQYRDSNEKFIVIVIKYFASFLMIAKDEQLFHKNKIEILLGIVFPLLLIPKQLSQQMIKQSPEKYLKLKQDMVGDYEFENIGSLSAKLLQTYCDKIDGITTLATQISFQIIQNTISTQYQIKNQFKNTTFFNIAKPNQRIEVALSVLCIVSYSVQQRKQCISLLEDIIQKHIGVLFNPWETEMSLMFIILLQYYIDNLFIEDNKQYLRSFVLDAVLTTIAIHPEKALLLVLYDFIQNMYAFEEYNMVIRANTFKIGQSIVSNIVLHQDVDAFHVFKELLRCQDCNVVANYNPEFLQWLQKITIKIKDFIQKNQFNQFVVKGLDLLDSLMMNEQFETLLDPIYNSISYYMLAFKNSDGPMFDQILTVINRYIEMKKIIPQSVNILLQNIQPILEINDSNIYNIFRTLCLVVVHSTQQQQIQRIYQLGLLTLKETTSKTRSIMNPLEGILLLHLSIWHHIDKFSFEYLKSLVQQTLKVLNYQYIKHHKVMYGKYVLIILQCLRFRFEETTQIIKSISEDTYQNFYKLIFEAAIYNDGYDRKVLIPSIVCMTYHKDFEFRFAYPSMRLLIDVLYNQYNAIKDQSIKPYQSDQSENEQQYRQQDLTNELTASQNTKQIFNLYPNPYAPNDQYAIFRELVEHAKKYQHSSQVFSKVVADLPIGLQNFLTNYALRIQKVQGQKSTQARKIFKVKRSTK